MRAGRFGDDGAKASSDTVLHHSTFSENRLNRFRESDILRHIFERVVVAAMEMGLVKGGDLPWM